jgi:hypothetical protein
MRCRDRSLSAALGRGQGPRAPIWLRRSHTPVPSMPKRGQQIQPDKPISRDHLTIGELLTDAAVRTTILRVLFVETSSIRAVLDMTRGPKHLRSRWGVEQSALDEV